jgi:biotin operon repressor
VKRPSWVTKEPLGLNKREHVEEDIKRAILNRKLKPGDRVPPEETLLEFYGYSRSTIRVAVNTLRDQGILFRKKAVGTFVLEGAAQKIARLYEQEGDPREPTATYVATDNAAVEIARFFLDRPLTKFPRTSKWIVRSPTAGERHAHGFARYAHIVEVFDIDGTRTLHDAQGMAFGYEDPPPDVE